MVSVSDEWELDDAELEAGEDLDLLFITYRPKEINVDDLIKKIAEHGFQAVEKNKTEQKAPQPND